MCHRKIAGKAESDKVSDQSSFRQEMRLASKSLSSPA